MGAAGVEDFLSGVFQGRVRVGPAELLRGSQRSNVSRYRVLEGPQGAPPSVIVKQAVAVGREEYDPELPGGPASRLFNEWAGLRFLTEIAGPASPAPRFYGGDRDGGLIVLEDLGRSTGLDQLLLGDDPAAAEDMLVAFAATLGRMHALTIGRRAEFEEIRAGLGPRERGPRDGGGQRLMAMLRNAVQVAGVEPALGLDEELRALAGNLAEPGPFLAYVHRDPCPDNCLSAGGGLKFVDFEFGGYGHALGDGVYGRIHFPTCWCVNRLPEHVPRRMEAAYRAELVNGCPEAADDKQFHRAVVEACAAHVLGSHDIVALLGRDFTWGIATVRQRALLRFDLFWRMTEEYGHLKAVGATVRAVARKLRALWPPEADAMPYYPAFHARSVEN